MDILTLHREILEIEKAHFSPFNAAQEANKLLQQLYGLLPHWTSWQQWLMPAVMAAGIGLMLLCCAPCFVRILGRSFLGVCSEIHRLKLQAKALDTEAGSQ